MRAGLLLLLGFMGLLQAADLPRPVVAPRITAVQPAVFTAGGRVRIAGEGLVFTWQANPTAANPASRMLRVGDRYLRIALARVSDDGSELLLTLAPETPWMHGASPANFQPDPAAPAQLDGPLGLTSLSVLPTAGARPVTDITSPFPVRWQRTDPQHPPGENR